MKKDKMKIAGLLLAIACVSCGAGGVVAASQPKDKNVVAKAATAEELAAEFTDNSMFTVSPYSENMELSYEFDESLPSGYEGDVMRIKTVAGQAYVNVDFSNAQLKASDVASISVRAYSPDYTSEDEFRFNNVSVTGNIGKYDMSTWCDIPVDVSKIATDENGYLTTITVGLRDKGTISTYLYIDSITVKEVEYTTYNLEGLTFRKWDANNNHIYLTPNGDWERPDDGNGGWTANFASKNGVGIMFGETQIATARFPGDMFIELGAAPQEGDVLTIGGTFYNAGCAVEYVIPECQFVWNGTTWEVYEGTVTPDPEPDPTPDPEPEYTTYNLDGLTFRLWNAESNHIYLTPNGTWERPDDGNGGWTADFVNKNGVGIMFGETQIATARFPGDMFIELGAAPQEGDVLTIGGTFYNEGCAVEYVIPESKFVWNGTTWEADGGTVTPDPTPDPEPTPDPDPTPDPEPAVTEVGVLTVHPHSTGATANKPKATQLYMKTDIALPFTAWSDKFTLESGDGWKLNGDAITPAEFISAEGNMFANLATANVQAGDLLSVSGTFVHATENAKYIIEESKFVWNGTNWEAYVEYTTYNLDGLNFRMWNANNNHIYLLLVGDWERPNDAWTTDFLCKNGVGVMFGEKTISTVRFPGEMFIELGAAPAEGDVLTVGGTFYNTGCAVQYVIPESEFIYKNGVWNNALDIEKAETLVALDNYLATFAESDYYEAEWTALQTIVTNAKAEVNAASSKTAVEELLNKAKAAMDEVATKAEMDENFPQWKDEAKAELETYKDATLYREAEQAIIASTVAQAKTDIDASTNWAEFNAVVVTAKAALDALWTDAQWTAAEGVVAAAKDELASYKAENDYHAEEWATIQSIIVEVNAEIDAAIGNTTAIADIVTAAKAKMDAVKTGAQIEAEEIAVLTAKAELEAYKAQSDYNEAEWNEIQAILANAYASLDEAIGDEEAIASIVAEAKTAMDKVLKAEEANAKALAAAKDNAEQEIQDYVSGINYELYSDAAVEEINGYFTAAMDALDAATAVKDVAPIVADMKAKIDGVAKLEVAGTTSSDSEKPESGCSCSSSVGATAGLTLAVGVVALALRKKKDGAEG